MRRTGVAPNSGADAPWVQRAVVIGLLLVLLALQFRLWTGKGSLAEVSELEERVEARRAENRRLAEHNAILEAEVRTLKDDPESLEARARSELGMIREGETFYMVLPPAPDSAP
ncbi:MAG TPA: septum formation initiator family protein [Pseudomonadales bacterium]|nr:septum formation initiator family protein [Pseudomonadales bacterium]